MEAISCKRCDGTGKILRDAFTYTDPSGTATHYPARFERCYTCDAIGTIPPIDAVRILKAISGRKGLRSAPPDRDDLAGRRAYYVWRLARFHGGADVTMPITAETVISGDPCRAELEQLAERVARRGACLPARSHGRN